MRYQAACGTSTEAAGSGRAASARPSMQLIRCTKKLQKEMGLKPTDLTVEEPRFTFLGSWHANLIHIERKKCVLFTNDKTLFNFLIPDLPRAQIRALDQLFRRYLETVLSSEDVNAPVTDRILAEYRGIGYASTHSKSVLGSMNDLAFHYKYHIVREGGVHGCDLPAIIRRLNRMPMGALDYRYPIDELRIMYGVEKTGS